jgi:hypothetical protein
MTGDVKILFVNVWFPDKVTTLLVLDKSV